MFVSTNAIFLQDDYIMNYKLKGRIDLREIGGEPSDLPAIENNVRQENATSSPISALIPHRSGRIVSQSDRYMFLGEAFQADEPCVYKKCGRKVVCFLILYVDDILLIKNDVAALSTIKVWLASTFDMKYLGEARYILRIKII